jgi:hypothetical protein
MKPATGLAEGVDRLVLQPPELVRLCRVALSP